MGITSSRNNSRGKTTSSSSRSTNQRGYEKCRRYHYRPQRQISHGPLSTNNEKKALLIGINYTGTRQELKGCVNDANRMKNTLKTKFNYKSIDILTDKNLTRYNNIQKNLTKLINSGAKHLYFQYSGHGLQIPDRNGDEKDHFDEALLAANNNLITDDELNRIISTVPKGTTLIMVIDACHSGSILDLPYKLSGDNIENVCLDKVDGNVICISGCKDEQVSMDVFSGNTAYGAMSNALQEVLRNLNPNDTWRILLKKLRNNLSRDRYAQIPQLTFSDPTLADQKVNM